MNSYIKVYDVNQDLNPNLTFTQGLQELLKDINDKAEVATIYFPAGTYSVEDCFNNNIYKFYDITGNFTGVQGEEKLIKELTYTTSALNLNFRHHKVLISSGNIITLPSGDLTPIGKEYIITKINAGSLTVGSNDNFRINEINSPYNFDNNSTWITKTFVFAGTDSGVDKWYTI